MTKASNILIFIPNDDLGVAKAIFTKVRKKKILFNALIS